MSWRDRFQSRSVRYGAGSAVSVLLVVGILGLAAGLAGWLGLVLLGAACLSLGLFASSLTENQIVAGVVAFALLLLFWIIGWVQELGAGNVGKIFHHLSLLNHYENFTKGVIDTRDLVYCLSFIYFFLFLTKRQLESRRWRA